MALSRLKSASRRPRTSSLIAARSWFFRSCSILEGSGLEELAASRAAVNSWAAFFAWGDGAAELESDASVAEAESVDAGPAELDVTSLDDGAFPPPPEEP